MKNRAQVWLENLVYALIWLVVFAIPVLGFHTSEGIRWTEVYRLWLNLTPFLALFAINNYFLIPFFLLRKRYPAYILSAVALIGLLFTAAPLISGKYAHDFPPFRHHPAYMRFEGTGEFSPPGHPPRRDNRQRMQFPTDTLRVQFAPDSPRSHFPADTPRASLHADSLHRGFAPADGPAPRLHGKRGIPPPMPIPRKWGPMLNDWLLAILLIGFNVAIRLMFRSISDARRMEELEHRNLRTELDHLKAQVNPHFLMNTLNNIHALIDIDDEKAKGAVIELSRIMRYMLYEADKQLVPLRSEVEFLKNYTSLMSIRYTDDVKIETIYPGSEAERISIPPLLLITLLENAFKHGVGGDSGSYIFAGLSVTADGLTYEVRNSMIPFRRLHEPGVGLENLRKRLGLLYGDRYTLTITAGAGEYSAELTIPLAT